MKNDTELIIGYDMRLSYNNTYMLDDNDQAIPHCLHCGLWLDPFQHRLDYSTKQRLPGLNPRKYDIAATLDHRIIVSQKFCDFCLEYGYDSMEYFELTNDLAHFQLKLIKDIRIDREKSQVRYGKLCPVCRRYDMILAGRNPWTVWRSKQGSLVFEVSEPIEEGFFRTELALGSGNKKSPGIIVGIETGKKLKQSGLTGVTLSPAYGISPGDTVLNSHEEQIKEKKEGQEEKLKSENRVSNLRSKRRHKPI